MNVPKKILVATDFNELSTAALRVAAELAQRVQGTLILLYADRFEPPLEFTSPQLPRIAKVIDASRRQAKKELERCAAKYIPQGVQHQVVLIEGMPVPAITEYAETHGIDLIAMGTHGRGGIRRIFLGSVAEEVMRRTSRPLLTVRDPARVRSFERIACTPGARGYAVAVSRQIGAALRVVGAQDIFDGTDCDVLIIDASIRETYEIVRTAHPPVITLPRRERPAAVKKPKAVQ